jgi:hypothetical protein
MKEWVLMGWNLISRVPRRFEICRDPLTLPSPPVGERVKEARGFDYPGG